MPTQTYEDQTDRIRHLNDAFRRQGSVAGKFMMTAGVASLPLGDQAAIMRKVMSFNAFTPENDPYGEHDFGAFEHNRRNLFWKIDYYSLDMVGGSENPADPAQTVRVLTIMFADEY
ncbi:DUF3768 domain-containing protein [Methylocystis sp. ATCC 49242]|uniref:DUF3768 domain-containing protein n=1 Tax=Methylocystis sp. ATCC 49242 TaxID=622637 RepID=UPI0001F8869A|nr:DUF3768 domain-containing protein [Methylocystis sp. ATCC 49242]